MKAGGVLVITVIAVAIAAGHVHPSSASSSGAAASANERLANQMAASAGWDPAERGCLDSLWTHESGFRADAVNPASGATGIPQLNPHYYAVPAGWSDPAVQIRWGFGYLRDTPYGTHTPCGAWAHEQSSNWY